MKKILSIIILVIIATMFNSCKKLGSNEINGYINFLDPAGYWPYEPVEGIHVELINKKGKIEKTAVTDDNGYFDITHLRTGTYTLHAFGEAHGHQCEGTETGITLNGHEGLGSGWSITY